MRNAVRSKVLGAIIAAMLLGAVACSSSSPSVRAGSATSTTAARVAADTTSTSTIPRHLPGHTFWYQTFVDHSRKTVPAQGAALPSRTLLTAIYRPNGRGPFPIIAFAHGLAGHPEKFTKLFSVWADAGFVVVAPAFPLTNSHYSNPNGNVGDVAQQANDMSYVITQVLGLTKLDGRLFRAIDANRLGVGGLSLGGLTTYNLVYSGCCHTQLEAAMVLDGVPGAAVPDGHVPLFIGHSDTDPLIPYSTATKVFAQAKPPVWLVTLHGASHASEWEDTVTPYDRVAERVTLDYWQATIGGDQAARARLQRDATVRNLASIKVKK